MVYYIILIFALGSLDLYTKKWAKENLESGKRKYILNGRVELIYVENRGIAFNKLHDRKKLILFMGISLLFFLAYLFFKESYYRSYISFIFAGGIGNTIDRIHRGYVVDFIKPNFKNSPVFNLADFYILTGIIFSILKG
jgi:signal peptidase II